MNDLRALPSVDQLLGTQAVQDLQQAFGRPLTLDAVRRSLDSARQQFTENQRVPAAQQLVHQAEALLKAWTSPSIVPVINATGVILHTNLGRAPLSTAAMQAIQQVSAGYSNLEYDLEHGKRGSRLIHAEHLLRRLTGAEAALVVNNNAAAVLLVLTALARRRGVLIARSQLVEIGGGFRVPDVMKQSGARLVEVGATNRVHLSDYEQALAEQPVAVIMRAHRSNFRITGFTSEPSPAELYQLAQSAGIPMVDDLGSGTFIDTARYGLEHEPTVQEALNAADLVTFSGDKLLGGPQAGIITGSAQLVARLKKHPLARAIRADKLCLAGLSATLLHYLKDEAETHIPLWRMLSTPPNQLEERAHQWAQLLNRGAVTTGLSTVGGGSLPGETLPTHLLALDLPSPNRFMSRLRQLPFPIIARLEEDRVLFDPRTVLPEQDQLLLEGLRTVL